MSRRHDFGCIRWMDFFSRLRLPEDCDRCWVESAFFVGQEHEHRGGYTLGLRFVYIFLTRSLKIRRRVMIYIKFVDPDLDRLNNGFGLVSTAKALGTVSHLGSRLLTCRLDHFYQWRQRRTAWKRISSFSPWVDCENSDILPSDDV